MDAKVQLVSTNNKNFEHYLHIFFYIFIFIFILFLRGKNFKKEEPVIIWIFGHYLVVI